MLADLPILTLITFSPLIGVLLLLFVPKHNRRALKTVAIAATLLPLGLAVWLYAVYAAADRASYTEQTNWLSLLLNKELYQPGVVTEVLLQFQYHLAVDGLSLPLVLLTALVSCMAALASVHISKRWKAFYIWFLLLEVGMLGVFLARDLVLFFIFFEVTLVAMYFLIGIWGYYNREKAANKFLIYNGLGSAFMLLAFIILITTAGFSAEQTDNTTRLIYSGNYDQLLANLMDPQAFVNLAPEIVGGMNPYYLSDTLQWACFILLLVAFGIKLPIFPFHTWMLKVHTEAPPAVVMIHSGVLLKMGAYGLIRFGYYLFPEQAFEWAGVLAVLGVINIVYGALLALVQKEFKLVLAYSSISHMGIVLLGLAAWNEVGMQGAVFQLVSHGLISALLFLIVGSLYERTRSTRLDEVGGLARSMPFTSSILLVAGMASLGLPGLSGFIGEFLSLLGLFDTMKWLVVIATLGIILTAVYVLRAVLAITFGRLRETHAALRDARFIEALPMITLVAFIVLLGVYPALVTDMLQTSFDGMFEMLDARRGG